VKPGQWGWRKRIFVEPSGISEYNFTTAGEFAQFCQFYINSYPEALTKYHSVREFAYPKAENVAEVFRNRPGTIVQYNNNRLLGVVEGVDGLKTGYIDESGYHIALTAKRGDTRLIAIVLGAPVSGGIEIRNEEGRKLLTWAFANFKTIIPQIPQPEAARIWKGKTGYVNIKPAGVPEFTAAADRASPLYCRTELIDPLVAPLAAGSPAGSLIFYDDAGDLYRVPLVTSEEIIAGNFFIRIIDSIRLFFGWK